MSVGDKSVVFLLGAGCSFDATVPVSKDMIKKLETLLEESYKDNLYLLYNYVKHTMDYGNKMFAQKQDFNVESLLVILHLLSDYKKAPLYPFISGYTNDLREYSGNAFDNIMKLIEVIERELPGWVTLDSYRKAAYYKNFERFQKELTFAIRIFSLNYDLCLEQSVQCKIETGFIDDNPWDGNRFVQSEDDERTAIYLYKLHGSIDWERKNDQLRKSEQRNIKPDLIFGTDIKLQAIDPYLFYLYEFRKYALASEIIISIGYSYNDNHINDLIRQAMDYDKNKKLISVAPVSSNLDEVRRIRDRLKLNEDVDRIRIEKCSAKCFLEDILSVEYVANIIPQTELPF